MKYQVTRTSYYGNCKERPCKNAYAEGCDEWLIPIWYIKINTLEDLRNLIDEVGEVIISKDEIEIYDTFRE